MTHDSRAGTLLRELADSMKAIRDAGKPAKPPAPIDIEAHLIAKYRDKPPPKLSAKARGLTTETLRPLRDGSKWGLPG